VSWIILIREVGDKEYFAASLELWGKRGNQNQADSHEPSWVIPGTEAETCMVFPPQEESP